MKLLKYFVVVMFIIALIFLYWNRDLEIDFSAKLPKELQFCNQPITHINDEYIELRDWLNSHQLKWKNAGPVSYAVQNQYTAPNISINILNHSVVINYKVENGEWKQVIHHKSILRLSNQCIEK